MHSAGYIYNDLKLDNLMTDFNDKLSCDPSEDLGTANAFENVSINLVDFGFATKFVEQNKTESGSKIIHKKKEEIEIFRGNMIFSSINQLQFFSTSRRDDLISLCYLLIYLVREGTLPNIEIYSIADRNASFRNIRDAKLAYSMSTLCNAEAGTEELTSFVEEIFSYRFKNQPQYTKLREMLQNLLDKYTPSETTSLSS